MAQPDSCGDSLNMLNKNIHSAENIVQYEHKLVNNLCWANYVMTINTVFFHAFAIAGSNIRIFQQIVFFN